MTEAAPAQDHDGGGTSVFAGPGRLPLDGDAAENDVDARFILPRCQTGPPNELEPVCKFVAKAVKEQHNSGRNDTVSTAEHYRNILQAIKIQNDTCMLRDIFIALRIAGNGETLHLLTSTNHRHARLFHQLFKVNPFPESRDSPNKDVDDDYALADAFLHLIMAVVSANSVFLVPAIQTLWRLLTFQVEDASKERTRRLHAALATTMRLVPKAKTELFPVLSAAAPFRTRPVGELLWYYRQCLAVTEYLPGIREQVLELLVDKSLEIDVEIKIHDGGEAVMDNSSDGEDEIFQLELEDHSGKEKQKLTDNVTVDEMADKLDSLMLLLFEYAESVASETHVSSAEIAGLYQVLSRVFESSVLITHKSKFVQFLLLYVCGLESEALVASSTAGPLSNEVDEKQPVEATLYREFAAKLIDIILDPYRATMTRQSGACYLASFVSRASFVCAETVCESVSALLWWAEAYMQSLDSVQVHAADSREQCSLHSLFYTVCQSAFYIICFRGADAVRFSQEVQKNVASGARARELEHIDLRPARWTRICAHPLDPLRYCLESVRSEFSRLSRSFGLIDPQVLDKILADGTHHFSGHQLRKKQAVSRITTAATLEKERLNGGVGGLGRGTNPLDSFFPFDPYLLRRSHVFVEPFYNHWTGGDRPEDAEDGSVDDEESATFVPTDDENSEDDVSSDNDDDDDEEEEEDHDGQQRMSYSPNAASISSRSITPQRSRADVVVNKETLTEVWSSALKRARAASIENGSW